MGKFRRIPREISPWGPKALAFAGFRIVRGELIPRALPDIRLPRLSGPISRRIRTLETCGLFGCPWAPHFGKVVQEHHRVRYRYECEQRTPHSKTSVKFAAGFEAFRAMAEAMTRAWGLNAPTPIVRRLLLWRVTILNDCTEFVEKLKEVLRYFRDFSMGSSGKEPEFIWFFPVSLTREEMINISLVSRALPAPLKVGDYMSPLLERWTAEPAPFPDELRTWISEWVRFNRPYFPENSWPFSPSLSACLEFSRRSGGLSKTISKLVMVKLSVEEEKWYSAEMSRVKVHCKLEEADPQPFESSLYLIAASVSCIRPLFEHARTCRGGCDQSWLHPTMAAVPVKERGWKVRVPTMLQAPIVILAKMLRAIADSYLRSDPRIRPSLEGRTVFPIKREGMLWRSQDLTTATDTHIPEVNRHFYREITAEMSNRPPWMDDVINVVCGYYALIGRASLLRMRAEMEDRPVPPPSEKFRKMLGLENFDFGEPKDFLFEPYEWGLTQSVGAVVSTCGQPMGLSTSWPLLPIYTLYAYEKSRNAPIISIERWIVKRPPHMFDYGLFSKILGKEKVARTKVRRQAPKDWKNIQTTGDDAIFGSSAECSREHTRILVSLGQVPSKTKDYFSDIGVYTEVFVTDNGILPYSSAGTLLAPRAVRSPSWYTQGSSRDGLKVRTSLWGSPFMPLYKHLVKMGCPIDLPSQFGGLGVNIRTRKIGKERAAFRLANKSLEELLKIDAASLDIPRPEDYCILGHGGVHKETSQGWMTQADKSNLSAEYGKRWDYVMFGTGKVTSKTLVTRSVPSPTVSLTLKEWDSIRFQMKTWEQIVFPPPPPRQPTVYEYIVECRQGRRREDFEEIFAEAKADLSLRVEVPWGILAKRDFALGFTRPSTPVPVARVSASEYLERVISPLEAILDE